MSTTPTTPYEDDGMKPIFPQIIYHYACIPHVLMSRIESVNPIIDNMISEYNKYQVGDYLKALKDLHSLKEHYNNQEACPEYCRNWYPIPSCPEHITLLLRLISVTDTYNTLAKKILANDLGDLIDTRETKQYQDVINARKALRKFYKKELQDLTHLE